jgi:chromosome segregation protein
VRITELRLLGFKSFVDPARAPIAEGLTGVVGPNGCGKSNLLEAVRWVMGATSAKSMRAGDMEDVIFAGSAGRPAREFAEVVLVLNDVAGRAPAPFHSEDTLEVSRRIRRGMGSTYRMNGKEVRAKDVQLLFADAATGANSPALVRQGQVSELIASKPENRRRILEEAAGIAGLHARRHEADLKLKAAEANLTRLDEVLTEIEGQATSLKKQARQAERYRGLAQTLRETEALLLHRRWREASERLGEAQMSLREAERAVAEAATQASAATRAAETKREALAPLREEEQIAAAVLRRLEGVRVGLERDVADADAVIARCDEDIARAAAETERLNALRADAEASLKRLAEEAAALGARDDKSERAQLAAAQDAEARAQKRRAQAEAALETQAAALAAAQARARALSEAAAGAETRCKRLEERARGLEAQIAALPKQAILEKNIAEAGAKLETARAEALKARTALQAQEKVLETAVAAETALLAALREAEANARTLEAEVRALSQVAAEAASEFVPIIGAIDVKRGYERAIAAALGDDLDAALEAEAPAHWRGARTPATKLPASVEPLAKFIKAPAALAARLSLIGVVSAEHGDRLALQLEPGARLVSREGDLWRWDGFVRRAAAPLPAAARLEQRARLAEARAECDDALSKLATAKAKHESARTTRQSADEQARAARVQAPKLANVAADAERASERLENERARLLERRADFDAQQQAVTLELNEARAALDAAAGAAKVAPANDESALINARKQADEARRLAAEASVALQAIVRERAQRQARAEAIVRDTEGWRTRHDNTKAQLEVLAHERDVIAKRRKAAEAAPVEARAKLASLMEEAQTAETRRQGASDRVAEAETAARQAGEAVRAQEEAHATAREKRAGALAQTEAAQARVADIEAHAREQTGAAPGDLMALAGSLASGPLAQAALPEIERRFERLKSERDAAGLVNLRAEEELAEVQARIAELTREKEDVAQAVTKLRRAIGALNAEGRERLLKAFEQVDAHFAQLFATLFEGGQANLKLTESEDPLEAGLEIFAQPPGKRLTTLSLLSGGEQALTATALIFAVFLANPAPLCVLDEVDAPLDDANVDRFCRLLEEMKRLTTTRFLVITHNPVTMARMDRLYGVTMPEQGTSQLVSVDLGVAQKLAAE